VSAPEYLLSPYIRAYEVGKKAREKNLIRVSPYYDEIAIINGQRVDITDKLSKAWLEGFDGKKLSVT